MKYKNFSPRSRSLLDVGINPSSERKVESAVIDFQTHVLGTESLTNLVSGHHAADRGWMTREDIEIKYEAKDAIFSDPVILININAQHRSDLNAAELYEATRKHWKLSARRVSSRKIACSVYRGIIREVYSVDRWLPSPQKGRMYFEGEVAPPEIRDRYYHKSVAKYWKKGSRGPIKYAG